MKANWPANTCILCGGGLRRETPFYICKVCGEKFESDEVGFSMDMPANPYRGDIEQQKIRHEK